MTLAACPNCGYSKTPPGKRSCYNCGRPLPVESETPVAGPQVGPAASPPPWASQPTQPDMPASIQPAQTLANSVPLQVVAPAAPVWAAITIAACPNCGYSKTPPGKRSCYNCGRPLPVESETPVAGPQVGPAASMPTPQPVDPASQAAANTPTIAAAPPAQYDPAPTPPPPAPPAWTPTHRVPAAGMAAWDTPDGSRPPIAQLPAYVELVVEANAGAWAQVRASNGWRGWVDGRLLTPVPMA